MQVNGTTVIEFNGNTIDLAKWLRLSMNEAIREFWPEEAGTKPALTAFESRTGAASSASCGHEFSGEGPWAEPPN